MNDIPAKSEFLIYEAENEVRELRPAATHKEFLSVGHAPDQEAVGLSSQMADGGQA